MPYLSKKWKPFSWWLQSNDFPRILCFSSRYKSSVSIDSFSKVLHTNANKVIQWQIKSISEFLLPLEEAWNSVSFFWLYKMLTRLHAISFCHLNVCPTIKLQNVAVQNLQKKNRTRDDVMCIDETCCSATQPRRAKKLSNLEVKNKTLVFGMM